MFDDHVLGRNRTPLIPTSTSKAATTASSTQKAIEAPRKLKAKSSTPKVMITTKHPSSRHPRRPQSSRSQRRQNNSEAYGANDPHATHGGGGVPSFGADNLATRSHADPTSPVSPTSTLTTEEWAGAESDSVAATNVEFVTVSTSSR
ncbi:hypothetical protein PHYPSEUDO_005504 [Phytophthora pseudosyringae]|uniref:Uncharacterized protein n=1 Tax=Phytophthora pseudosyringae TaxID=221518 RepID=A0A8T1VNV0_9STRA|nr:hypothetical protein PHYPSEUDO_005504 [Phytophthora pseudosyringae]